MKRVLSFSLSDFHDLIKDNTARGKKSLVFGRRVAFAVKIPPKTPSIPSFN